MMNIATKPYSSLTTHHFLSLLHAVEIDRPPEDFLGRAAAVVVEVVDALVLGQPPALLELRRHGRAVQQARADGDVARLLRRLPRRHEDGRLLDAVEFQQLPAKERPAHARLAAAAQV